MSSSGSLPCVWCVSQNMRDSLVLNSTSLRGNLHIWVSTASLVGGFTSRSYSTSVRMWHSQYTGVRCVCCLLVGRPTLRLLVRSHGGRGADALGFRRISTSSERTGRLAHQSVVSGRLRTGGVYPIFRAPGGPRRKTKRGRSDFSRLDPRPERPHFSNLVRPRSEVLGGGEEVRCAEPAYFSRVDAKRPTLAGLVPICSWYTLTDLTPKYLTLVASIPRVFFPNRLNVFPSLPGRSQFDLLLIFAPPRPSGAGAA